MHANAIYLVEKISYIYNFFCGSICEANKGRDIEPLMSELKRLVRIIGKDKVLRLLGYTTATATATAVEVATNK